eukprot:IDg8510t1
MRFLLAHVAVNDLELKQVDVKTAFLHGELADEIYMEVPQIPEEVITKSIKTGRGVSRKVLRELSKVLGKNGGQFVLKLQKALYGLKQAAKEWHIKLKGIIIGLKFVQSTADPCLFTISNLDDKCVYLLVYVDDIIVAGRTNEECEFFIEELRKYFTLSAMDDAHFFLGVNIGRDRKRRKLWMSQTSYVDKILRRFGMVGTTAKVPMANGVE